MGNKKTLVAIIMVVILIISLLSGAYFYNQFNVEQVNLLIAETNKILKSDLIKDTIDFNIKTEKNYAKVEKSVKEYIVMLKNIYLEMEEMVSGINPNLIFSAQNVQEENLEKIDDIIYEYKEKSQNFINQYTDSVTEEKIIKNIQEIEISTREDYYINLYKEIMLNDSMQNQYQKLDEEIKNEKARLYDKLNKIVKIKEFLIKNSNAWKIEDNKISFTNLNRMTECYDLLNQLID